MGDQIQGPGPMGPGGPGSGSMGPGMNQFPMEDALTAVAVKTLAPGLWHFNYSGYPKLDSLKPHDLALWFSNGVEQNGCRFV